MGAMGLRGAEGCEQQAGQLARAKPTRNGWEHQRRKPEALRSRNGRLEWGKSSSKRKLDTGPHHWDKGGWV